MNFSVENCIKATGDLEFEKKYSICTLVTDLNEYREFLESAYKKGFTPEKCEYLWVDNTKENIFDAYGAINYFLKRAKARYVILCHQDLLLIEDDEPNLEKLLHELDGLEGRWACAGNAGTNIRYKNVASISMPGVVKRSNLTAPGIAFPEQAISLDENFMVVNNIYSLSLSWQLSGFHLYGIDLCQNAIALGLKCYIIDFHLFHKSLGNIDSEFRKLEEKYKQLARVRKASQYFQTVCTKFYVSGSPLKMALAKNRSILRWIKGIHKRKINN